MLTGGFHKFYRQPPSRMWRGIILALGALLASGLLLGAWIGALAAPEIDFAAADAAPANEPLAPTAEYDFEINKTKSPVTFTVGTGNRYIINVSGIVSSTVGSNPVVSDILPDGITVVSISTNNDQWLCNTNQTKTEINCIYQVDIPAPGGGDPPKPVNLAPIIVDVNVASDIETQNGVVTNTANLTINDGNQANNISHLPTPIDSVDLEIEKTVKPTAVKEGEPVVYKIVVVNHGPSAGKNVRVEDVLSTDMTYQAPNFDMGSWVFESSTKGVWTIGPLPADVTATLTMTATPKAGTNGEVINNTATVKYDNKSDWNLTNNSDSASVIVGGLEISKHVTNGKTSFFGGEIIHYMIVVTNTSPNYVNNVRITDVFTPVLSVDEVTQYVGSYYQSGNTLTNYVGSLGPFGSSTYRAILRVDAFGNEKLLSSKTVKNKASVTWGSPQLTETSNEVEVDIAPAADLHVTKVSSVNDDTTGVLPSQEFEYTIQVKNRGGLSAPSVRLIDTISTNLSFISIDKGSISWDEVVSEDYKRVWDMDNPIAPGETVTIKIKVKVDDDVADGQKVQNTFEASTIEYEANTANNIDTAINTVDIQALSDIAIAYQVQPTFAEVGDNLTFKVRLTNNGDETINNIEVSDAYPGVVDLTSASATLGTVTTNTSARSWVWKISSLKEDESATLTIVTRVNSTATTVETYRTEATLTYSGGSKNSNTVAFRVLPAGTLPGTGWNRAASDSRPAFLSHLSLGVALGLGLLGLAALGTALWARTRRPLWAAWYGRAGLILVLAGLVFGAVSWGLGNLQTEPHKLAALSGEKPPLPTAPPARLPLPTLRPTPTATTQTQMETVEIVANPEDLDIYLPTPTPNQLPDYPVPTPSAPRISYPGIQQPESSAVTRIVIPAIGVDAVVKYVPFNGDTWLIGGLKHEVAWMGDTSWPGLGGNTGLAGHVDLADGSSGPFWRLSDLKPGDEVILYTEQNIYIYTVREQVVVDDHDLSVVDDTDKPQITLITCTGWDALLRIYVQRLVVFSDLVKVAPIAQ